MATYEIQLQFVSAFHVPVGDFFNGSSDPYIQAIINHKTDDELYFRTSTCRSTRDPKWQKEDTWHLGGIKEGTHVKIRMLDEDPRKMDNDRIGVSELRLEGLEQLCGQKEGKEIELKVQKRKASVKVYILTYTYSWLGAQDLKSQASRIKVKLTVKRDEKERKRPCLIGPIRYDIHFSPILGRLAHTKSDGSKVECFLGYQMHLRDVPDCRFPYTKKRSEIVMMYSSGIRGALIRRALRSQHSTIYGFDSRTIVSSADPDDAAARFLEMTDAASQTEKKMFTYAITPDGCIHFTRTGEQFAINHLSKHAMHSNAAKEVVYSGEFFFVEKGVDNDDQEAEHTESPAQTIIKDDELVMKIRNGAENIKRLQDDAAQHTRTRDKIRTKAKLMFHKSDNSKKNPSEKHASEHHHKVSDFTLVIDNSSGTFMPDAKDLPKLQKFLESNFPGLKIKALAQDDPKLKEAKKTRKLQDDDGPVYGQGSMSSSSSSSISFSDPAKPEHRHPEFHATN
ncbi:Putative uncharacterized protein [Taphrina deformans PYCC 5710]|uniref:C2 domain-containing protein n=1 Tax=Taphrina deformans (strain PYCC 5710 / ATCC 11124 / CBS 356.35 / IMI 108563 / JCM 9778 / NBRC 8474) TaxID=1097556 RepID=R4X6Z1_TAPDE|nr:Putative uncharacterized protein [Taphrina deformans PYCC 5710]|eukprot:CCG80766.1 Putative uncharacterized protein [Taphrina deformans PYCC 5710]